MKVTFPSLIIKSSCEFKFRLFSQGEELTKKQPTAWLTNGNNGNNSNSAVSHIHSHRRVSGSVLLHASRRQDSASTTTKSQPQANEMANLFAK